MSNSDIVGVFLGVGFGLAFGGLIFLGEGLGTGWLIIVSCITIFFAYKFLFTGDKKKE